METGWQTRNGFSTGVYNTRFGRFEGQIERKENDWKVFIKDPPGHVFYGSHASCFKSVGEGWYWIHMNNVARSPGDAILAVEAVINEG